MSLSLIPTLVLSSPIISCSCVSWSLIWATVLSSPSLLAWVDLFQDISSDLKMGVFSVGNAILQKWCKGERRRGVLRQKLKWEGNSSFQALCSIAIPCLTLPLTNSIPLFCLWFAVMGKAGSYWMSDLMESWCFISWCCLDGNTSDFMEMVTGSHPRVIVIGRLFCMPKLRVWKSKEVAQLNLMFFWHLSREFSPRRNSSDIFPPRFGAYISML